MEVILKGGTFSNMEMLICLLIWQSIFGGPRLDANLLELAPNIITQVKGS